MDSSHRFSHGSSSLSFVEPDQYQASVQGAGRLYSLLGRGTFRAELTTIRVGRLLLQRGREYLPRLASSSIPPNRVGIVVWFGEGQLPVDQGMQILRGDMLCLGPGMQSHQRTFGSNDFAALTLNENDLTKAAIEFTGSELTVTAGKVLKPPVHIFAWLLAVIETATRVTETTPGIFSVPQVADALEDALLQPMIMCLVDAEARKEENSRARRSVMAKKFEEAVEANFDRTLLMPDLCRIVGMSGRTLRTLCHEQLGVSPQRFLALRRLHLARRALLRADYHSSTVAEIATGHGVWELGRFAVTYKALFGESPSETLHRLPETFRA